MRYRNKLHSSSEEAVSSSFELCPCEPGKGLNNVRMQDRSASPEQKRRTHVPFQERRRVQDKLPDIPWAAVTAYHILF